jgi:hypothetical protein
MLFTHFFTEELTAEHPYFAHPTAATPTPYLNCFNALAFHTMKQ